MPFHISYLIQINIGILDLFNQHFYCDQYQWHLPKHRKVTYHYWPKELKTCILKTTKITETEEDLTKREDLPHSWIRILDTVRMAILHKFIYRFNASSLKTPAYFFTEIDTDPKVHMEIQGIQNSQQKIFKKNKLET